MAEVIWMPGALNDIDAIAAYIALDPPSMLGGKCCAYSLRRN